MKKIAFAMLLLMMSLTASSAWAKTVAINKTNFPDAVFRKYVSDNFDTNGDGKLSDAEAKAVKSIYVSWNNSAPVPVPVPGNTSEKITNLKGIEYFTALTTLDCTNNALTSLNVSKNTALTKLSCSGNELTSLDVSKNTALTSLSCSDNELTSLNVSKNTALTYLFCSYNKLTSLNVGKNTTLTDLSCYGNELTSLNLSKNIALTNLNCSNNELTSLNLSKNIALTNLNCSNNELTSLNVSKNTALTALYCSGNELTSLNVDKNTALTDLSCSDNELTSLNVSKNTALTYLSCSYNKLKSLNVSGCTALTDLSCSDNELTSLNVSKNTALTYLYCSNNELTSLNVSKNTALTYLFCSYNKLTSLNVGKNTTLTDLSCSYNKLESLDVSKNTALTYLYCSYNKLKSLNVSGCSALTTLDCNNNKLKSLNVIGCTALTRLDCSNNRLKNLNVSQCISLSSLSCYNNRLTKLDVSNCGKLLSDWSINCDYDVQIVRTTKTKPTIITSSLPNAAKGQYYRESLKAYGSLPISWTAKGLPAGLTCDESGNITGASTEAGTFTVTVTAKNSKGSVSKKLTLKVGIAPTITTTSLKNATKGKSYSVTLKATGSKTITWSAPGLPAGLTINATTGKISGKPTEGGVMYYFAVTAKNAYGSHTAYLNLYIAAGTSSSSAAAYTMNADSSTEAKTPETSLDSPNGKSSRSGKGNSSPSLRAETQTEGYVIAHVFDDVISVDKAGLYDFDVEFDEGTPEGWTLVWLANSSEPSDDDEIADFFNSEGAPIEIVPGDKKITVSVWLNPNRKYEPAIAVKKVTE